MCLSSVAAQLSSASAAARSSCSRSRATVFIVGAMNSSRQREQVGVGAQLDVR